MQSLAKISRFCSRNSDYIYPSMFVGGYIGFIMWLENPSHSSKEDYIEVSWRLIKYISIGATFPISVPTIILIRRCKSYFKS